MRSLNRLSVLMLGALACACGPEFDPLSLLNDYRLIALATDTPDTVPEATLRVQAVDFDPVAGRTPGPTTWTVCPYSLGASVVYECLVPETELVVEGSDTLEIDLGSAEFGPYRGLRAALEPAAEELTRQLQAFDDSAPAFDANALLLQGVDVYVKVETGPEGQRQASVRRIRVTEPQMQRCSLAQAAAVACAGDNAEDAPFPCPEGVDLDYLATATCETEPNANPGVALFEVQGLNGAGQAVSGSRLTLKVIPGDNARQAFYQDDPDALCPDSDDQAEVRGGPCQEELYYRWYTSRGEFSPPVTFESDTIIERDTELTLPKGETGPLTVFVVAYDGRGGVSQARKDLQIVAP